MPVLWVERCELGEGGEDVSKQGSECCPDVNGCSAARKWGERERHRDGWVALGVLRGPRSIVWTGLELRMDPQPLPHKCCDDICHPPSPAILIFDYM